MLVSIIGSLKENFTKKVRNPFFGTLTVVFILKNWQLFYSLLFFDSCDGRSTRIEIIEKYIDAAGGSWMFAKAVGWTFAVLIVSYILQGLGAFISNVYDSRLHPWIISIATKGASVVTKEKYELEVQKNKTLEDRLKEERDKRYSVESELDRIVKKSDESKGTAFYVADEPAPAEASLAMSYENKIVHTIMTTENWDNVFDKIIEGVRNEVSMPQLEQSNLGRYLIKHGILKPETSSGYAQFTAPLGNKIVQMFLEETASL